MDYYVFELLIYRDKEKAFYEKYYKALESFINKYIPNSTDSIQQKRTKDYLEDHFWKNYGGPWNYNQVVGAIKIFTCGDQIRGDLWLSNKKRFTRIMGNKNISLFGKAFEMTVFKDMTNEDINQRLIKEITNSIKQNERRIIDMECFLNCSKYIDWMKLLQNQ